MPEFADLEVNIIDLAKSTLLTEAYDEFPAHTLWKDKAAILIFLRHFACVECRVFAKQIWDQRDKFESGGGKIHFIGNGRPNFIEGFREDLSIQDAPIYTDPSLKIFRAAGFKRGFLVALGPRSLIGASKLKVPEGVDEASYKKGMGDLWQMGGVLVIKPEGRVAYKFASQKLGDFPPEKDVIDSPGN